MFLFQKFFTKNPKIGFAFVNYKDEKSARLAIKETDESEFLQKNVSINATYAKTQKIRKEKQFTSGDGSVRHDDFRDDSVSHVRRFDRRLNRSNGRRRRSSR